METTGLLQRLEAFLPAIKTRPEQVECDRRLPRDPVSMLRDTGVFSLELPRALGGLEAAPSDNLRALELVARADGSTGWCTALAVANNGVAGFMSEAGAREVFADPTAPTAGVFAPSGAAVPAGSGMRVSGRWQFCSSLQRHARDADAAAHHFTVSPHVWEDAGRVLLGRSPTAPMF